MVRRSSDDPLDTELIVSQLGLNRLVAGSGLSDDLLAELRAAAEVAAELFAATTAASTGRAYSQDWAHFTAWCSRFGLTALPAAPETVVLYLGAHADSYRGTSTLEGRLSGIAWHHLENGHRSPTRHPAVVRVKSGLTRTRSQPADKKEPLYGELLARVVEAATIHDNDGLLTRSSARDRALILLGQGLADRRSEITAVDADRLRFIAEGLLVGKGRDKTNQTGEAYEKLVEYNHHRPDLCPVLAVDQWMATADIELGAPVPLFRSVDRWGNVSTERLTPQSVNLRLKAVARRAGVPEHLVAKLAGHSLRSGLVNGASLGGAEDSTIMRQTRHKNLHTMTGYQRADVLRGGAAAAAYSTLPPRGR